MTEDFIDDIDPNGLREAEMIQARMRLANLVGHSILEVRVEDTRIALVADGGTTYFFYGFMGEESGSV